MSKTAESAKPPLISGDDSGSPKNQSARIPAPIRRYRIPGIRRLLLFGNRYGPTKSAALRSSGSSSTYSSSMVSSAPSSMASASLLSVQGYCRVRRCGAWTFSVSRTCRTVGLTSATEPITKVGTVSFPSAMERTSAASSGDTQMLCLLSGTPVACKPARSLMQKGQPGRQ